MLTVRHFHPQSVAAVPVPLMCGMVHTPLCWCAFVISSLHLGYREWRFTFPDQIRQTFLDLVDQGYKVRQNFITPIDHFLIFLCHFSQQIVIVSNQGMQSHHFTNTIRIHHDLALSSRTTC